MSVTSYVFGHTELPEVRYASRVTPEREVIDTFVLQNHAHDLVGTLGVTTGGTWDGWLADSDGESNLLDPNTASIWGFQPDTGVITVNHTRFLDYLETLPEDCWFLPNIEPTYGEFDYYYQSQTQEDSDQTRQAWRYLIAAAKEVRPDLYTTFYVSSGVWGWNYSLPTVVDYENHPSFLLFRRDSEKLCSAANGDLSLGVFRGLDCISFASYTRTAHTNAQIDREAELYANEIKRLRVTWGTPDEITNPTWRDDQRYPVIGCWVTMYDHDTGAPLAIEKIVHQAKTLRDLGVKKLFNWGYHSDGTTYNPLDGTGWATYWQPRAEAMYDAFM